MILNHWALFSMILGLFLLIGGCDSELKEHKGHPAVVKKLEMQSDPALQAKAVTGTVILDPSIQAGIPGGSVLFIYARAQGVTSGPPVAVRKMTYFQLPQEFSISPADAVMTQEGFDGPLTLSARLDRDGNARAGAGDITGSIDVTTGQKGVTIVLSQVIEETGNKVTGTISLDPALKAKLSDNKVIFIFARPKGVKRGPPLAAKRIFATDLPMTFTIGQSDTMMPGAVFDGPITLTVRLDQDGNASTAAGDIEGSLETHADAKNVRLVLNHVIGG
jgi:hypothetical protein